MSQPKIHTNDSLRAERFKLINSRAYKRRVKNSIQMLKTYFLMDKTPRSNLDANKGKIMTKAEMRKFAHLFAEEIPFEQKRRDRDSSRGENDMPRDSVKI